MEVQVDMEKALSSANGASMIVLWIHDINSCKLLFSKLLFTVDVCHTLTCTHPPLHLPIITSLHFTSSQPSPPHFPQPYRDTRINIPSRAQSGQTNKKTPQAPPIKQEKISPSLDLFHVYCASRASSQRVVHGAHTPGLFTNMRVSQGQQVR